MQPLRIHKLCNAFIPDAIPSDLVPSVAVDTANRYKRKHGGLWVGGSLSATSEGISFTPNGINIAFHVGLEPIHIPLTGILSVRREFGWITGIVVVEHALGEFRFRCFGAKKVAQCISGYITCND